MAASQRPNRTKQKKNNNSRGQPQVKSNLKPEPAVTSPEIQRALADPRSARPETILQLQRIVGNRAMSGLIQRQATPSTAQAKAFKAKLVQWANEDMATAGEDTKKIIGNLNRWLQSLLDDEWVQVENQVKQWVSKKGFPLEEGHKIPNFWNYVDSKAGLVWGERTKSAVESKQQEHTQTELTERFRRLNISELKKDFMYYAKSSSNLYEEVVRKREEGGGTKWEKGVVSAGSPDDAIFRNLSAQFKNAALAMTKMQVFVTEAAIGTGLEELEKILKEVQKWQSLHYKLRSYATSDRKEFAFIGGGFFTQWMGGKLDHFVQLHRGAEKLKCVVYFLSGTPYPQDPVFPIDVTLIINPANAKEKV